MRGDVPFCQYTLVHSRPAKFLSHGYFVAVSGKYPRAPRGRHPRLLESGEQAPADIAPI